MSELSILYGLTAPDGTRIAFGNTAAVKADADYVGWLNPEEGVSGLDGPEVREATAEIIAGDGGIHYDFFHGRRPITISGVVDPNFSQTQLIAALEKIKRATNAMAGDAILRWTNTGQPARRLAVRRQQPPRFSGRRPKNFLLALVASDYRLLSEAENSIAATALNGAVAVTNAGNAPATPRLEVVGPAGASLSFGYASNFVVFKPTFSLSSGQTLVVDMAPPYPKVTVNGVDRYDAIDFVNTKWWGLPPGATTLTMLAGSGAGTWRVFWRDAWI